MRSECWGMLHSKHELSNEFFNMDNAELKPESSVYQDEDQFLMKYVKEWV